MLNIELDSEELNQFVKETQEEADELDRDVQNLRVVKEEDPSVKSMQDGKTSSKASQSVNSKVKHQIDTA